MLTALAAATATALTTGASAAPASSWARTVTAAAGPRAGAELYGRDCAGCHGPAGEGSPRGVPLTGAGEASAHYMLVTGRMPLREAGDVPRRGPSPYSQDQIDSLVAYVAALGDGPALPDVDWRDADLSRGGTLYRLHCGACHSATAIGGALAFDRFAPSLMPSEPSVVAAAVTAGPGAMPSFTPLGFTDEELAAIVAYVQEIRDPVDHGGWPMLRAGRADETLFTWLAALPAVVLLAVWIARKGTLR